MSESEPEDDYEYDSYDDDENGDGLKAESNEDEKVVFFSLFVSYFLLF
jgi:hypothetical protein